MFTDWLTEFSTKAVYGSVGTECYFDRATALDIISRCESENRELLGVDGASLENGGIREPIDAILDLSQAQHAYVAARAHVMREEYLSLVWCLTLGDDPKETAKTTGA